MLSSLTLHLIHPGQTVSQICLNQEYLVLHFLLPQSQHLPAFSPLFIPCLSVSASLIHPPTYFHPVNALLMFNLPKPPQSPTLHCLWSTLDTQQSLYFSLAFVLQHDSMCTSLSSFWLFKSVFCLLLSRAKSLHHKSYSLHIQHRPFLWRHQASPPALLFSHQLITW
jgi:hypothetical protein